MFAGEQLETVHIERQRAQAAYDLIDHYNHFSREDISRIDSLKREGREGRRQVAIILRRLNTVAKEVDLPSADKVFFLIHLWPSSHFMKSICADARKYREILREV
jgi:hypothetical protein